MAVTARRTPETHRGLDAQSGDPQMAFFTRQKIQSGWEGPFYGGPGWEREAKHVMDTITQITFADDMLETHETILEANSNRKPTG
jgi:hypothetical protein